MLRPYLRIRPALWVQTRLYVNCQLIQGIPPSKSAAEADGNIGDISFPIAASGQGTGRGRNVPAARALAVVARARVPDGFVRHVGGFCFVFLASEVCRGRKKKEIGRAGLCAVLLLLLWGGSRWGELSA